MESDVSYHYEVPFYLAFSIGVELVSEGIRYAAKEII
jgi:hypothetical protein